MNEWKQADRHVHCTCTYVHTHTHTNTYKETQRACIHIHTCTYTLTDRPHLLAGSQYGQQWSLQGYAVGQESPPGSLVGSALEEHREEVIGQVGFLQGWLCLHICSYTQRKVRKNKDKCKELPVHTSPAVYAGASCATSGTLDEHGSNS